MRGARLVKTHSRKVYKQASSVSNEREKTVAQKKFKQTRFFLLLVLDISIAHADNAECHHNPWSSVISSTLVDSLIQ